MSSFNTSNPSFVLAAGLAIAACIAAALWGLALVIPAVGAAIGLGIAVASTGFATAGAVASWLPTAASAGLAAGGASITIYVVSKVVESGKNRPYEWTLPALTVLAVFFVDMTKEIAFSAQLERAIFAFATGMLTLAGGFLLLQRALAEKIIGFLLPFFPAIVVVAIYLKEGQIQTLMSDILAAGNTGAIGLVGAISVAAFVAILGITFGSSNGQNC
jgi:hypothetical protein